MPTPEKSQSLYDQMNGAFITLNSERFNTQRMKISATRYVDGNPAVYLFPYDASGQPIKSSSIMASTNLEGYSPSGDGCFLIKNWAENDGLLDALIASGKFEKTSVTLKSGFVEVCEVRYVP